MVQILEDARTLAHGTYDDVIIVEHRRPPTATAVGGSADALRGGVHVVLEMPEGSRVIDSGQQFEIDGLVGDTAPTVGSSYRVIVAPSSTAEATPSTSLRYESMNR